MTVRIRTAATADVSAIAAIHTASWRDAYAAIMDPAYLAGPIEADRQAHWEERMRESSSGQIVLIAEAEGGAPIGFVRAEADADPRWGNLIDNLHVLPTHRGRGLGPKLLRRAIADLRAGSVYLWVFEANQPALGLYLRLGGRIVERTESSMIAAEGKPELRIHWPDASVI